MDHKILHRKTNNIIQARIRQFYQISVIYQSCPYVFIKEEKRDNINSPPLLMLRDPKSGGGNRLWCEQYDQAGESRRLSVRRRFEQLEKEREISSRRFCKVSPKVESISFSRRPNRFVTEEVSSRVLMTTNTEESRGGRGRGIARDLYKKNRELLIYSS